MRRGEIAVRRSQLNPFRRQWIAEALEERIVLAGWLAAPSAYPLFSYARLSTDPVPDGTVVTAHADLSKAANNPPEALNPEIVPSGTITLQWYGGPPLATFTATPVPYNPANPGGSGYPSIPEFQVPLVESSAGIPIASGPYKGFHILYVTYSGDGNFAPTAHVYDATDYAAANSGVENGYFIKFSDASDAGTPTQVQYIQQPQKAAKGNVLQPPVRVAILDADGKTVTSSSDGVTLTLSGGDGTLAGTTTVAANAGIATFNNLSIDKPGTYQITAASGSLTQAVSAPFVITAGQLDFLKTPKSGTAGNPLEPIIVAVKDDKGKVITSDNTTTITLSPIGFTGDAPITGNVATVVNGVATFDNLILKKTGFYQLQASDDNNNTEATSKKFKVAGNKLSVSGPKDVDVNTPFAMTVKLLDAKGKPDINATSSAQLSLNSFDPSTGATLSGTTTVQFVGGLATFTPEAGPIINQPGRYTLTVTEVELSTGVFVPSQTSSPVATKPFSVGTYHLVFQQPPRGGDVDQPLSFAVAQVNKKKKVNTSLNSHQVALTLTPLKDTPTDAKLSDFTNIGFTAGVQTFASTHAPSIDTPGLYTLTATEVDATGAPILTTEPAVSKPFKVTGYELTAGSYTPLVTVNRAVAMDFVIFNANGQTMTSFDGSRLGIELSPAAPFGFSIPIFSGGGVSLPDRLRDALGTSLGALTISNPGKYKVTARVLNADGTPIKSIAPAVIKSIQVSGQRVSIVSSPRLATAKQPVPMKIVMLDAKGKVDTEENEARLVFEADSEDAQLNFSVKTFSNGVIELPATAQDPFGVPTGVLRMDGAGSFKLVARAVFQSSQDPIETVAPDITRPIKVLPPRLGFVKAPVGIAAGFPLPFFQVGLYDIDHKFFPGPGGDVFEASYRATSSKSETILGSATVNDQGVAEFSLLNIPNPGRYVIIIRDTSSVNPATEIISSPITIVG